jgi:hypothetical protein
MHSIVDSQVNLDDFKYSDDLKDLIKKMLNKNQSERITLE